MQPQHHYLWIFFAFCVLGMVTYVFTINRPDNQNYAKGSVHNEVVENNYPLSLHPCGAFFKVDGKPVKVEVKK